MGEEAADALYREIGLDGILEREVFVAGVLSAERHGEQTTVLAIAEMSQPSTTRRVLRSPAQSMGPHCSFTGQARV